MNTTTIVDGNIYAYLLIDYPSSEILDGNKIARSFYKKNGHFPNLFNLFLPSNDGESLESTIKTIPLSSTTVIEQITSLKADGTSFSAHLELCKIDNTLLFLVVKEMNRQNDGVVGQVIDLVNNPIFQITPNESFFTEYGSPRFYHCIRLIQHDFEKMHQNSFLDLLVKEKRYAFAHDVNKQIELYGECDITVELNVETDNGQLFQFNAFLSTHDKKLYGVLVGVKKQKELLKKIEYDQQYFDVIQKYTKDLLFRIDVTRKTLVHRGDISMLVDLLPEMDDFPECMRRGRLVHPDDLEGYIAFSYLLMNGTESSYEPRFRFSNDTYEKYKLQGSPLFNDKGETIQVVGKCENIQKFVDIESKANYDPLTSALNKQSFKELIEHSLKTAVSSDKFAILFLDVDDFKGVNDELGHVFGDFLLEAMSKRILNCIRSQDRMGRVGGDEFVIFFQFAPSHEAVQERAEAILHSLRRDFTYGEQRRKIKASIGVAMFPEHGNTYDILYDRADKALYKSKALGKDVATIYSEEMN